MKVALIGGSGFVGTHLLNSLKNSGIQELLNLDKNNSSSFPDISRIVDVRDGQLLENNLQDVDVVVLLAAEHRDDVSPVSAYYEVNVTGMRNTLMAMENKGVKRLIFTSSVAIYGLNKDNPSESFPAEPFNHYGCSKWDAEELLQQWSLDHKDWNIHILRPTVIFGEGNKGNVFNLLNQIASGRFLMIGAGNNQKSMSYVGNIVAFITYLIQHIPAGYHVFNYVDKPDFTTNDLVRHTARILNKQIPTIRIPYWMGLFGGYCFDAIAAITGKKMTISAIRVKKFCAVTQYDATKVQSTGFVPPYTLAQGLERMLNQEFIK